MIFDSQFATIHAENEDFTKFRKIHTYKFDLPKVVMHAMQMCPASWSPKRVNVMQKFHFSIAIELRRSSVN